MCCILLVDICILNSLVHSKVESLLLKHIILNFCSREYFPTADILSISTLYIFKLINEIQLQFVFVHEYLCERICVNCLVSIWVYIY